MKFDDFFRQYGGRQNHPRGSAHVVGRFADSAVFVHGWFPVGDDWLLLVEEVDGTQDGRFLRVGMMDGECFSELLTLAGVRDVLDRLRSAPSGLMEYVLKGSITPATIDLTPANNNFGHKPIRAIDH